MDIFEHTTSGQLTEPVAGQVVLIVDDDGPFSRRLARAIESRGFMVKTAETVADALSDGLRLHSRSWTRGRTTETASTSCRR